MKTRILSWNVQGDLDKEGGAWKVEELTGMIEYWSARGEEISIICLQETSGTQGALYKDLETKGYQLFWQYENAGGQSGRCYIIAVKDTRIGNPRLIEMEPFSYESIASSPTREPLGVQFDVYDDSCLEIYTLHATLGSRRREGLECFSEYLDKCTQRTLIGADLNAYSEEINYRPEEEELDEITKGFLQAELFKGYTGYGHRLDYIIGKRVQVVDGIHSAGSNSDHCPISAEYVL